MHDIWEFCNVTTVIDCQSPRIPGKTHGHAGPTRQFLVISVLFQPGTHALPPILVVFW